MSSLFIGDLGAPARITRRLRQRPQVPDFDLRKGGLARVAAEREVQGSIKGAI